MRKQDVRRASAFCGELHEQSSFAYQSPFSKRQRRLSVDLLALSCAVAKNFEPTADSKMGASQTCSCEVTRNRAIQFSFCVGALQAEGAVAEVGRAVTA